MNWARRAAVSAVVTTMLGLAGCATGDGYYYSDSSSYSGGSTSNINESTSSSADLYAVEHNGNTYILNEHASGEADIVSGQGVTVVEGDKDGTATVMDPNGDVSIYVSNGMGGSFKVDTSQ